MLGTQGSNISGGKHKGLAKPCQSQAQAFLDSLSKVLLEDISFLGSLYPSNSTEASFQGTDLNKHKAWETSALSPLVQISP